MNYSGTNGSETLSAWIAHDALDLEEFFGFARKICSEITRLHSAGEMLGVLYPGRIEVSSNTELLEFLAVSSIIPSEPPLSERLNLTSLSDAWPYLAPEMTGRMNRLPDKRSDLYSLGMLFFHLLTGRLPVAYTTYPEWTHWHLTATPVPVHEWNPLVPMPLSAIVAKLIAKDADDRYQDAGSLQRDLGICNKQWNTVGKMAGFAPGSTPVSRPLVFSDRLFGRDETLKEILSMTDFAKRGSRRIQLLSGSPGVGKSALAAEAGRIFLSKGMQFFHGKFEPLQKNTPYGAFVTAFRQIAERMLGLPPERLEWWKSRLLECLESNGRVIIELVPDFRHVLGTLPDLPQLGIPEAQHRFRMAIQDFLRAVAPSESPLVLLLDDLHWADAASLELLRIWMQDTEPAHILIIGTFREGEGDADSQLGKWLGECRKLPETVRSLFLEPLQERQVTAFLQQALCVESDRLARLSELVFRHTQGNPFSMRQLLLQWRQENMLRFEYDFDRASQPHGHWVWDLKAIENIGVSSQVSERLNARINGLEAEQKHTLLQAACFGTRFQVKVLADHLEQSVDQTLSLLGALQLRDLLTSCGGIAETFDFQHDNVREAAYRILTEPEKHQAHWRIGQRLLAEMKSLDQGDTLFEVANHLIAGISQARGSFERNQVAQLIWAASRKALASAAYFSAANFIHAARRLLGDTAWEDNYPLAFGLALDRMECEALVNNVDAARACLEELLEKASTPSDKLAAYCGFIRILLHENAYGEAITLGTEALRLLGVHIPKRAHPVSLLVEMATAEWLQRKSRHEKLRRLSPNLSAENQTAQTLLTHLWVASYWEDQALYALVTLKMVNFSMRHGNAEISSVAYVFYGAMLNSVMGRTEKARWFGDLGLGLSRDVRNPGIRGKVYMFYGGFINLFHAPLESSLAFFEEGYKECLRAGERVFAGFAAEAYITCLPMANRGLDEVESECRRYAHKLELLGKHSSSFVVALVLHHVREVSGSGGSDNPAPSRPPSRPLGSEPEGESGKPPKGKVNPKENSRAGRGIQLLYAMQSAFLAGEWEQGLASGEDLQGNPLLKGVPVLVAAYHVHAALLCAEGMARLGEPSRRKWLSRIRKAAKQLRKWKDLCPENFQAPHDLVHAALYRIQGDFTQAARLCEAAVEAGRRFGSQMYEAEALEQAARNYLEAGSTRLGCQALVEAEASYVRWGALPKATAVRAELDSLPRWAFTKPKGRDISSDEDAVKPGIQDIDLHSVMAASRAISGEIVFKSLLAKLLETILKCAGAQRVALILERKSVFIVEAEAVSDKTRLFESTPLDSHSGLPTSIVYYVARTEKSLILSDARTDTRFIHDPYLRRNEPRSVLCAPLLSQGKLRGIIYAENNLTTSAFTLQRLEVLNILAAQAAISLTNADYHSLQIEALQARVSPHFLFNALSSIAELILDDPAGAEKAVILLSGLYRYILTASLNNSVPLSEELEIVHAYLMLEKLRFGDKLDFEITSEGDIGSVQVPGLIIQPLAENSVRHGISPNIDGGKVSVHVENRDGHCRIIVSDNGLGLGNNHSTGTGYGLKNVQERLKLVYGEGYSLSISSQAGYRVEINLRLSHFEKAAP